MSPNNVESCSASDQQRLHPSPQDRTGVLARVGAGQQIRLELGCGPRKVDPDAVGVDLLPFTGVDLVGEIYEVLALLPDGCASAVYTSHFLEHVSDLPRLMTELGRVMSVGATLRVVVPHFSNPFYYSDPTHRVPFGLYTFSYFCDQDVFVRTVPQYGLKTPFRLVGARLGFRSYRPRYVRHAFKRAFGALINSTVFLREFYEENLCWLVSCYEVEFEIRRV